MWEFSHTAGTTDYFSEKQFGNTCVKSLKIVNILHLIILLIDLWLKEIDKYLVTMFRDIYI